MVLGADGEALVGRVEAGAACHRPAFQRALHLEAEVVVQPPRGMLLDDERGGLLPDRNLTSTDFLAAEEFDAALARAQELAATAVDGMRAGKVDRNPVGGTCPRYCSFQPICRRERAALEALEDEAPRAEENGAEAPG
jgi:hypothetical protein